MTASRRSCSPTRPGWSRPEAERGIARRPRQSRAHDLELAPSCHPVVRRRPPRPGRRRLRRGAARARTTPSTAPRPLIARCAGADDVAAALRYGRDAGLPGPVRAGGHGPDGFAVADGALDARPAGTRRDRRRSGSPHRPGGGRRHLARARPRHRGPRPRRDRRADAVGRRRRLHARLRLGLAGTPARPRGGLAALRAGGHERRRPRDGERGRAPGPVLGAARRRLELRRRRRARVRPAPGRPVDRGRDHRLAARARAGGGARHTPRRWPRRPTTSAAGWRCSTRCRCRSCRRRCTAARSSVVLVAWTGAPGGADALLAPLRALGARRSTPSARCRTRRSRACSSRPSGSRRGCTARAGSCRALTPETASVLADRHVRKPAPLGSLLLQPLGGAFARMPAGATPLGRRGAPWAWQAGAAWFDPAADAAVRGVGGRAPRRRWRPWSGGESFPNFVPDRDPDRLRAVFGDDGRGRGSRRSAPRGTPTTSCAPATRSRCRAS